MSKMHNKKIKKDRIYGIITACISVFILAFIVFAAETALRFHYGDPAKLFYSLKPSLLFHAALFRRSPVPHKTDPAPRVFCLGGSTTNGCNMPINKSYPNILHAIFRKEARPGSAYNFGISGVSAVTTNFFVKNILPKYEPSCIVIHDGYNDLPVVLKKEGEDLYSFIAPDYETSFNPYIANPIHRYIYAFVRLNLRSIYRFSVELWTKRLKLGGDLFLGYDYKQFDHLTGTSRQILLESQKRTKIMIEREIDTIDYCLSSGTKVIVILEPHIKPHHYMPPFESGFRDEAVGEILSRCHKIQQALYARALMARYANNKDVMVLDMREIFRGRYEELFYDECHLNAKGNSLKALIVFRAINELFPL